MYHANLSDICNKFSKRFSFENFIDRTAILNNVKKQNQNLIECNAHMPLTAAGTFLPSIDDKKVMKIKRASCLNFVANKIF